MQKSEQKLIKRERTPVGTYDVTYEEVERTRVFPEDEVREILAEAIHKGKLDIDNNPEKYRILFDPYREIARIALDDINSRFDLTIKPKLNQLKEEENDTSK